MKLSYFVQDLCDPAVRRRVQMFEWAGISGSVIGFWRGSAPPDEIGHMRVVPLERTFDGALAHRARATLKQALQSKALVAACAEAQVFMARNLEMLTIALATARLATRAPRIVYEVLDIHRVLVSGTLPGRLLRAFERTLLRDVDLVIVSSPAFRREYFERFQFFGIETPCLLVENKSLLREKKPSPAVPALEPPVGPPWIIAWLGMIRCARSLKILAELAQRRPDLLRVRIFGRPTKQVASALGQYRAEVPALEFGGTYQPSDLARIYGGSHFSWAIDYFEEGGNSRWLLPNRIYEGGMHDVVPLALEGTETSAWLNKLAIGVMFQDPDAQLEEFLQGLTPGVYRSLKASAAAAPRSAFVADVSECMRLRSALFAEAASTDSADARNAKQVEHQF